MVKVVISTYAFYQEIGSTYILRPVGVFKGGNLVAYPL